MKRDHQQPWDAAMSNGSNTGGGGSKNIWPEEEEDDDNDNMDELLAVLGYKVRSSDMADVAERIEQLETVLSQDDVSGSDLLNDTVHYNPSDLSGWIESLLSELNSYPPSDLDPTRNVQTRVYDDGSEYDLRAITGDNSDPDGGNSRKRMRYGFGSGYDSVTELNRSVVMVDTQETGVRLVHTLMACAEAVQNENLELADALVKHVGLLAASQPGAMRKVATYFAEALARRIYRIYPSDGIAIARSYDDVLQMHFYESCPYLKFAHFTANQAILEASSAAQRVHVIDFGLKQGMQWPALIQALALRPGGVPAPSFRLTGVVPPQPDNPDELQQVGWKLAQFASRIGVEFEFKGLIAENLADLEPEMFEIRPGSECVAISSVLELHRLLARPGSFEKVMATVKALKPEVFAVVEQEADHNDAVFVDRFNSALHYYSSMFDSLEDAPPSQDRVMSELYMGRQILNVVACEGADRVERHEPLARWRARMRSSGLEPVSLGSNAFKQATVLLALFAGGNGYGVDENDGCLTLGWNSRPLIAASAWKLGCAAGSW